MNLPKLFLTDIDIPSDAPNILIILELYRISKYWKTQTENNVLSFCSHYNQSTCIVFLNFVFLSNSFPGGLESRTSKDTFKCRAYFNAV